MARDVNEEQLWQLVDAEWDTFTVPGKKWTRYTDRMAETGRAIIRRECPKLPSSTVEQVLARFFKRAGCNHAVPPPPKG